MKKGSSIIVDEPFCFTARFEYNRISTYML